MNQLNLDDLSTDQLLELFEDVAPEVKRKRRTSKTVWCSVCSERLSPRIVGLDNPPVVCGVCRFYNRA